MDNDIKQINLNITEIDFNTLMEEVDDELRKAKVPIHARTIRALIVIRKRFKVNFLIAPSYNITSPHIFTNYNMATHVAGWYEKKYGDRLKMRFGPGQVAIMIKDDPWKIYLPEIYGQIRLVCDLDIEKYRNIPNMSVGGPPPILNILACIENMTSVYARTLTKNEMHIIINYFTLALDTLRRLKDMEQKPYIKEALSDLYSSVSHIFSSPPHYGQSKWSTLQFIEKLFKCYLKINNVTTPRTHDLNNIAKMAEDYGAKNIDYKLLSLIVCSPGIRYGELSAGLDDAIKAHDASIKMAHFLGKEIDR